MEPLPLATLTEAIGKAIGAVATLTLGLLTGSRRIAAAFFLCGGVLVWLAVREVW